MSKVTYEEAINSNSVLKELITEGYKTINNFPLEQYFIHEENVKNFIAQHRPLTLDEVVEAWEKVKKDLIEIVTDKRNYYVKCDYEVVKTDLIKYAGENDWVLFDEVYELHEGSYEYTKSNREELLLKIEHIIAVSKINETLVKEEIR